MDSYSYSIGHMLILVIPRLKLFSSHEKEYTSKNFPERKGSLKKNILHYFVLIFLYNIQAFLLFLSPLLDKDLSNIKLPHEHGPFTKESIIIILIAIVSFFLFKSRNYAHHNISLGVIIIMAILMDIIFDNFSEEFSKSYRVIIINIIEMIFEVLNFCFQKYMVDNL